jgi:signal transduction histidine kinase/ligand-binding sensor domain-containing protein
MILLINYNLGYSFNEQYEHLTVKDGLPSNTIYKAYQDSKGFIWFTSDAGVARYDGVKFENFTMDEGLSDNEVIEIKEDSKGRIWFLTFNGLISYFYKEKIFNQNNDSTIKNFSQSGFICSIYEDKEHNIWFGRHNKRITKLTAKGKLFDYFLPNLPMGYHANQPYFFEQKDLYCMTSDAIFLIDQNGIHIKHRFTTKKIAYFVPYINDSNKVFYPAINGIFSLHNGKHECLINDSTQLDFKRVMCLTATKNEDLWITTEIGKTSLFKKINSKYILENNYLDSIQVIYVMQDREENLWFCTRSNGVFLKASTGLNSLSLTNENGLIANEVLSIYADKFKGIWIGYVNGKVQYLKENKYLTFDCNYFHQTANRILDITSDSIGNILLASDQGLFIIYKIGNKYSSPQFIRLSDNQDGGRPYYSKNISLSSSNRIYFNSAVCRGSLIPNKFGYVAKVDTTNSKRERIFVSYIDKEGIYWISTINGLISIKNNKLNKYYNQNLWLKERLIKIAELSDGNLILCTAGKGFALFNKHKIISITTKKEKLGSNTINDVIVFNDKVYLATNGGVSCFSYKNGKLNFKFNYNSNEGLLSNKVNSIEIKDSVLYAATSEGLSIIKIKDYFFKPLQLQTNITYFNVNGTNRLAEENMSIEYKKSHLQVHYKAPVFTHPELLSYQYQLIGKSDNWVNTTNDFVEFYGLPSGKYTFRVRAKYNDIIDEHPAELTFTITPPFWLTKWFASVVIIGSILIIYLVLRMITRRKYKQELYKFESERNLAKERTRIADEMHDDVGADLSNLLLKIRMDEVKNLNNSSVDLISMRQATSNIIKKIDEIIWSLNAQKDTLEGLINFIAKYHQDVINSNKLTGKLKIPSYIPYLFVRAELRRDIFLTIKETVNNTLKHASASELNLYISISADKIDICITDNGIGFNQDKVFYGNGLGSLQKRAIKNKGSFTIKSKENAGTEVILSFPIS